MSNPVYLSVLKNSELVRRVAEAEKALQNCHLCGNHCGIDRTQRTGPCGIGNIAYVVNYGPHHGEEDVLRGRYGSGTIFFSGCNLHCVYCQNYDISQYVTGRLTLPQQLAEMMLDLQNQLCHNVNLVSPTHVVPHIIQGLVLAIKAGLHIPVVYNTGGYDTLQALNLMNGLVDIYMPDMKYANPEIGKRFSLVEEYPAVNQAAVKEMHRQVGDLVIDEQGIAQHGLLVRHLVLPGELAGTAEIARFLAQEVSPHTYVNVMRQYHPAYKARNYAADDAPLGRSITSQEYQKAVHQAQTAGLYRFDERRRFA